MEAIVWLRVNLSSFELRLSARLYAEREIQVLELDSRTVASGSQALQQFSVFNSVSKKAAKYPVVRKSGTWEPSDT